MKILKLSIENIKNVKAAELSVAGDGRLVKVCGKNAAGKTAILDSIYWALGGKPDVDQPIREDSDKGDIKVALGMEMFPDTDTGLIWLKSGPAFLNGETPIQIIMDGSAARAGSAAYRGAQGVE